MIFKLRPQDDQNRYFGLALPKFVIFTPKVKNFQHAPKI